MSSNHPAPVTPKVSLQAVTIPHLVLSVIVTAIVTAGNAVLQYTQVGGHFSITELLGIGFSTLLATLGMGVVSLEKNPAVAEVIDSTLTPYLSVFDQQIQQHAGIIQQGMAVVNVLSQFAQQQASTGMPQGVQSSQPPAQAPAQQQGVTAFSARQPQPIVLPQSQQPPVAQQAFPPAQGISFNDTAMGPAFRG